jgi:isoprenylcysteine carboxyl methyltransferase (ICMT) family protein YpbQ
MCAIIGSERLAAPAFSALEAGVSNITGVLIVTVIFAVAVAVDAIAGFRLREDLTSTGDVAAGAGETTVLASAHTARLISAVVADIAFSWEGLIGGAIAVVVEAVAGLSSAVHVAFADRRLTTLTVVHSDAVAALDAFPVSL